MCATPRTCIPDGVKQIKNPTLTRLSPTAINVQWEDLSSNSHVSSQHLTVYSNTATVYDQDVPLGTTSVDIYNLQPGTKYTAKIQVYTDLKFGLPYYCSTKASKSIVSSCILTPNPANIDVGQTQTMTTGLEDGQASRVEYRVSPSAGIVDGWRNDTQYPYTDLVTGLGNGTATLTNNVIAGDGSTLCTDTATINVGTAANAGSAWWQAVGG